jgi:DNA modification methylase
LQPYYQRNGITLYNADCRDVLPCVEADVLVTDPPYGVNLGATKGVGAKNGEVKHGLKLEAYASFSDTYEDWLALVPPVIEQALRRVERGAVFTGPHVNEQPKAAVIGGVYCPSGVGRHTWGFKTFLPVLFYGTAPDLHLGAKGSTTYFSTTLAEKNGHPVPKPVDWMLWLVSLTSRPGETVLDPFAGSGTTLVAAKRLGRRAVGIEIEEAYCELAARRLDAEPVPLFTSPAPAPEQASLAL